MLFQLVYSKWRCNLTLQWINSRIMKAVTMLSTGTTTKVLKHDLLSMMTRQIIVSSSHSFLLIKSMSCCVFLKTYFFFFLSFLACLLFSKSSLGSSLSSFPRSGLLSMLLSKDERRIDPGKFLSSSEKAIEDQ